MGNSSKHWDTVYETNDPTQVSWFESEPKVSLDLISESGAPKTSAIVDIGAGVSRLAGALINEGYKDVSALDHSEAALANARDKLPDESPVKWVVADAMTWSPLRLYDLWHDRAAFHFLTRSKEKEAYLATLDRASRRGGHVIIGTFALDGPETCSGLPVQRYGAETLTAELGSGYRMLRSVTWDHETPFGKSQRFHFGLFLKR